MRPWVEELRQLGWRRAAFRLQYELRLRSGLEAALRPAGPRPADAAETAADAERAARLQRDAPALVAHLRRRVADPAVRSAAAADRPAIEHRLAAYGTGRVRMFSRWEAAFGDPLDWHLNPRLGRRWPAAAHWATALRAPGRGDIKLTWEPGRQAIAYEWARSAALEPAGAAGDAARQARDQFGATLAGFEASNPYRAGVQWASGQELAIRLLAWWFAFGALGGPETFADETVERLVRQTRLHARHLAEQIGYARYAVYNNHLIGEAVALVLAADMLPDAPEAARWRALGRGLLEGEALSQFEPDGGYCQASHTYHRLALHYYVWYVLLGDLAGRPVAPPILDVLGRSRDYLLAQQNAADGWLPNWGANDGALCSPLAACDYADFRPVVRTLTAILGEPSHYPAGPWDAEAAWLVARPYPAARDRADQAPAAAPARAVPRAFPASGLYVTGGSGAARAVLRAGTIHTRFGQADQHHVDLWWDGVNVVLDPGTYSYHERPDIHRAFSGTGAHSTVTVDGLDQMVPYRKFKWLRWSHTMTSDLETGPAGLVRRITATHDGYLRPGAPGVRHERQVDWTAPDRLRVTDRLIPVRAAGAPFRVRLHWLLADCVALPAPPRAGRVALARVEPATFAVTLAPPGARALAITVAVDGVEAPAGALARAVPDSPWGWHSRYYGVLEPAVAFTVEGMSRGARLVTTFAAA
ncbi:MAG: alginate lyase family protein [Gemmatimonadota bacterium]